MILMNAGFAQLRKILEFVEIENVAGVLLQKLFSPDVASFSTGNQETVFVCCRLTIRPYA